MNIPLSPCVPENLVSRDIADSGRSCHMTHDRTELYDLRPRSPGREIITIGDRRKLRVECAGNIYVIFDGYMDERITLTDISYVSGLGFDLYSLHAVQKAHIVVSNTSGTHVVGTNLTFPRSSSRSYLRATRLPAGTEGAKKRQRNIRANDFLR